MAETNSISVQLYHLNRLYNNAIVLLDGYNTALKSDNVSVDVSLENEDGTSQNYTIPTNTYLKSELDALKSTVSNITGFDDGSIVVDSNGGYREVVISDLKTSIDRIIYNEVSVNTTAIQRLNPTIGALTNPLLHVDITLPTRLRYLDKVNVVKYEFEDSTNIVDGMSYYSFITTISDRDYKKYEFTLDTEKGTTRYYGSFDILTITTNTDGTFEILTSSLAYSDSRNIAPNTRSLDVGDYVVTSDGGGTYIVTKVTPTTKKATLKHVSGLSSVSVGVGTIQYNDNTLNDRHVYVPMASTSDKYMLFISPISKTNGNVSPLGNGIYVVQSDMNVVSDDGQTLLSYNEYVSTYVNDIGGKLDALLNESSITRSQGITPDAPVLLSEYFDVKQINTHITKQSNIEEIKRLSKQKNTLKSNINVLNNSLYEVNSRISEGNYSSTAERKQDITTYNSLLDEINRKTSLFATTVNNIKNISEGSDVSTTNPKYRVIGFWPVQDNLVGVDTISQTIVQYEIRYRYLSSDSKQSVALSVSYDLDGTEITGTKSNWNIERTNALERVQNANGTYSWSTNSIEDVSQININECSIPIQSGESVEIQVRAISEAGYPYNPIKSAWSNSTVIEFPESLTSINQLLTIVADNETDIVKVEIDKTLKNTGITKHVIDSFEEQNLYFAHPANKLFSGFRTTEQTPISIFEKLLEHDSRFIEVFDTLNRRSAEISIDILDKNSRSYTVSKWQTLNIFDGYYTDSVDISNSSNYGTIIESVYYLRLTNRSSVTGEIISLNSGNLSINADGEYTKAPIHIISSGNDKDLQRKGQIFYLRNTDMNTGNELYVDNNEVKATFVNSEDIDTLASVSERNVVSYNNGTFTKSKLKATASITDYNVILDTHPLYLDYVNSGDSTALVAEFNRISELNGTLRTDLVQPNYDSINNVEFLGDDKYTIGRNTVGSKLYVSVNDISNAQVSGVDSGSTLIINSGVSNSILIPLKFQYRMTDALGNVDGITTLSTNSNFEYKKKVGFDLYINNETIKFDVVISAKFRPNTVSTQQTKIDTINRLIDSGSSSTPKIV